MNSYFLDALAPLVFRSGKPFGAQSDTDDIQFPLPSAAAGLVRTQIMRQKGWDWDGKTQLAPRYIRQVCVAVCFFQQYGFTCAIQ